MTVVYEDISFTYSGGASNTDASQSLGGDSSDYIISDQRLFPDVTPTEATNGLIDYRCFYVHNQNEFDTLYNAEVLVYFVVPGDVTIQMGVYINNERQNLVVLNYATVTSGTFTLTYTDIAGTHDVVVNWDTDMDMVSNNIQGQLQTISGLEEITVTPTVSGSDITFEINFVGTAGHRYHDLLEISSNDLSPTETISVTRSVAGGPINSVATEIDVGTTIPSGVTFYSSGTAYTCGEFRGLDSVPIWIRRTVPAGSEAIENDGFTFRLFGNPIA